MSQSRQTGILALDRLPPGEIWDAFYFPSWQERGSAASLVAAFDAERGPADRFGLVRQCALLHVGVGTAEGEAERRIKAAPELIQTLLRERAGRVLGLARLNANDVSASLAAIDDWLVRGPMVGICFPAGGQPGSLACDHENFAPLVRAATAAGGVVLQMNRYTTGEPDSPELSTPAKLATLASRNPHATFISGHAGADWERGIRAVRGCPNVLVETSGFDSTAGFIEMAVRELGAQRVVFGTHSPGRSLGTELAKVLSADISDSDRALILSGNLRRVLTPILRKKRMLA
jgi:predicted TIM-barrel fold metal-dependent hydrolase